MEEMKTEDASERIRGKHIWDCRVVAADDLNGYENAVWDLFKRKYDCLLVRGALSPEVCAGIAAAGRRLPESEISPVVGGWTFPQIFYDLAGRVERESAAERRQVLREYFERCQRLSKEYVTYLGTDIAALAQQWLEAFGGGCKVAVPTGIGSAGEYAGITLRAFKGNGQGQLSLQCGNYLQTVHQHFYEHLEGQVDVYDQLSFYFMIQKPLGGGEVNLFDLEWEEGQTKADAAENDQVMLPEISVHRVYAADAQTLDPHVGDLVIFAAGQIWHRVEPVLGDRDRMTLGGFAAYSYDKKTIYHWS